jgi:hypothetical protein
MIIKDDKIFVESSMMADVSRSSIIRRRMIRVGTSADKVEDQTGTVEFLVEAAGVGEKEGKMSEGFQECHSSGWCR